MIILGLDISTVKIGYSIINSESNQLLEYSYINVEELSKDLDKINNTDYYYIFKKVEIVLPILKQLIDKYQIKNIFIEKPNQLFASGGSRMDVLVKLILFNYTISNEIYQYINNKPIHIDARSARSHVFGKGFNTTKPKDESKKKINIKEKVFQYLCSRYSELNDLKKNVNKNNKIYDFVYDITDSIVIGLYGSIYVNNSNK